MASSERLPGDGIGSRRGGQYCATGHAADNLGSAQLIVVSSAIRPDNPELREARNREIQIIRRGEMLAEIMRTRNGIAVAGSHGKTTTTSLIDHVLHEAGIDPTSFVGGRVMDGSRDFVGMRRGQGEWLVAEADESDGSFLQLAPVIAIITNIDAEHLDHYGSLAALRDAFTTFAEAIPFWGRVVACVDHPGVREIAPRITRPLIRYGFSSGADLRATELKSTRRGVSFCVQSGERDLGKVELPLPGEHNALNGLAALAVALEVGIPFGTAAESLTTFGGVERRFQDRGTRAGVRIVDDYAHHPAELRSTLAAARSAHAGRIVGIFQPHRYTRTRDCLEEFAAAFDAADRLIVSEIYAAGDPEIQGITGKRVADEITAHGHPNVDFIGDLDAIAASLSDELRPGDLVLTLGAGNISGLAEKLLKGLASREARSPEGEI